MVRRKRTSKRTWLKFESKFWDFCHDHFSTVLSAAGIHIYFQGSTTWLQNCHICNPWVIIKLSHRSAIQSAPNLNSLTASATNMYDCLDCFLMNESYSKNIHRCNRWHNWWQDWYFKWRAMFHMMMPWHGNPFRITGPLWRESTGHWCIPFTNGQWCQCGVFVFCFILASTIC